MTPNRSQPPLELWQLVAERSRRALAGGFLRPKSTEVEILHDGGVDFIVRKLNEPRALEEVEASGSGPGHPFLPPYEEGLLIRDVSPTHVCILNKYCVLDRHILVVTRTFEDQEELLTKDDFAACLRCREGVEGLVFYNSGADSGASQRHKHLQVVPLPLAEGTSGVPMAALLAPASKAGDIRCSTLPFAHGLRRISRLPAGDMESAVESVLEAYRHLYRELAPKWGAAPSRPYNLLFTSEWMLMVPRARATFDSVGVNALGFAGSLLVRNDEERALIHRVGPMNVLRGVGLPP